MRGALGRDRQAELPGEVNGPPAAVAMEPRRARDLAVFRDTRIADKIGFDYARWDAREAVNDLISTSIAGSAGRT